MENNLAFHAILEREINDLEYGQIDVTCVIQNGQIALKTINLLKSKRIKYKDGTRTSKDLL